MPRRANSFQPSSPASDHRNVIDVTMRSGSEETYPTSSETAGSKSSKTPRRGSHRQRGNSSRSQQPQQPASPGAPLPPPRAEGPRINSHSSSNSSIRSGSASVMSFPDESTTTSTTATPSSQSSSSSASATSGSASPHPTLNGPTTPMDWKMEGNLRYTRKDYVGAVEAYEQGLQVCSPSDVESRCNLLSNQAMGYLHLQNHWQAHECCSRAIELNPNAGAKVWYRRAVARESLAKLNQHQPQQRREFWLSASEDLQVSLRVLKASKSTSDKERRNMHKSVSQLMDQVNAALEEDGSRMHVDNSGKESLKPQKEHLRSKIVRRHSSSSGKKSSDSDTLKRQTSRPRRPVLASTAAPPTTSKQSLSSMVMSTTSVPSPSRQRQDVIRLLLVRLQKIKGAAVHGEAFFLLDWRWWTDFLHFVQFFDSKNTPAGTLTEKQRTLLSYLPQGATIPKELDDYDENRQEPPGPIDNSFLFLQQPPKTNSPNNSKALKSTQQLFYEHWYLYPQQQTHELLAGESPKPVYLRPNLVRGYHYEIIPREVYSALREWYGEITPSVCRRAARSMNGTIRLPLYLHQPGDQQPQRSINNNPKMCAACRAPNAGLRCTRCVRVFYCSRSCQESHWPYHKSMCRTDASDNGSNGALAVIGSDGRTGLNTLGNTCFMNAAIQCLSHATPLTRMFLSKRFMQDINKSNPLGTGGKLAHAYETVLKELWMRPPGRSISPTTLKRAITITAPRFAGCLQHDAQEFLAYLLDGLHEDLNRIQKAPYVEMPDWDDTQNMARAGAEAWNIHLKRNDSIVQDLFYGQFQSTCVCPQCNHVSVSLDAMNHVSLEIPQPQHAPVTIPIIVVRAPTTGHMGPLPLRVAVSCRRNQTVADIVNELSAITNISSQNLHLCEVSKNVIVRIHSPEHSAGSVMKNLSTSVYLAAYEAASLDETSDYLHAIIRHGEFSRTNQNSANSEDETDDEGQEGQKRSLGLPLLTSFPISLTCRQVWQHLEMLLDDQVDNSHRLSDVMVVRVTDSNGRPLAVFPDRQNSDRNGNYLSRRGKSSLLPTDLDEELLPFLGPKAAESFVFLTVEWRYISRERFGRTENDKSWLEFQENRRSMESKKAGGITLDQCFETFGQPERLDDRNLWYCSKCKQHVRALKTMAIQRLPNVLIVHLKRFEFKNVLRRDKLDTPVDFPLEGLDMSRHCADVNSAFVDEAVPALYDLFGVVNHYGRMGFGHYTAMARTWSEFGFSSQWDLFDDSTVRQIAPQSVVSSAAYVLFYRRRVFN